MKKDVVDVGNLSMSSPFFSMNAFEKFDLPFTLNINLEALEQRYFKAQHQYHPDRLQVSNGSQDNASTEYAAAFNEAYQVLKDPLKRANHLLKCLGWLATDAPLQSGQDPKLLAFMMELNEKIEAAVTAEEKENLAGFLQDEIHQAWDGLENAIEMQEKSKAVNLLTRLTYLHRLKLNLK